MDQRVGEGENGEARRTVMGGIVLKHDMRAVKGLNGK